MAKLQYGILILNARDSTKPAGSSSDVIKWWMIHHLLLVAEDSKHIFSSWRIYVYRVTWCSFKEVDATFYINGGKYKMIQNPDNECVYYHFDVRVEVMALSSITMIATEVKVNL